jgi:hypothetical protein
MVSWWRQVEHNSVDSCGKLCSAGCLVLPSHLRWTDGACCRLSHHETEVPDNIRTFTSWMLWLRCSNVPLKGIDYGSAMFIVLQRVEPLLRNDREIGGYSRAVSRQRLGKHVPVARQQILNNATVGLQQWKTECFLCRPCRDIISKGHKVSVVQFYRGVCEERTWAGGRGIAIVGAVTRKRLITDWKH